MELLSKEQLDKLSKKELKDYLIKCIDCNCEYYFDELMIYKTIRFKSDNVSFFKSIIKKCEEAKRKVMESDNIDKDELDNARILKKFKDVISIFGVEGLVHILINEHKKNATNRYKLYK